MGDSDWQRYEKFVHDELKSAFPDNTIQYNVKLPGHRSGVLRQVDVLMEMPLGDGVLRTVVDAKFHSRKVDVKEVESFLGFLSDVGVRFETSTAKL